MYVSRATPTLTGQQQGAYDALTTSSLAVTGNASVAGLTNLAALTGSAITDLLTMSSSTTGALGVFQKRLHRLHHASAWA